MQINIGKTGQTVDVDESKFSTAVSSYVFRYGLTQILNDAHSQVTEKSEPDREARLAAVNGLVAKKLDALYAGEVRSSGGGRTGDPVMAEAKRIALRKIMAALKAAGKKVDKDNEEQSKAIRAAVGKLIESDASIMADAKAAVAKVAATAADTDLAELGL